LHIIYLSPTNFYQRTIYKERTSVEEGLTRHA
jgi:hypothetical protein